MGLSVVQAADPTASLIYRGDHAVGTAVGSTGAHSGTLTRTGGGSIVTAPHPWASLGACSGAFAGGQILASAAGGTAGSATDQTDDFSVEAVVTTGSDVTTTQALISYGRLSGIYGFWAVFIQSGRLKGLVGGTASTWRVIDSASAAVSANSTYHVMFTREATTGFQRIYVNGGAAGSIGGFPDYHPDTANAQACIGALPDLTSWPLASDAVVADLAVYTREIGGIEVADHYAARLVPDPCAGWMVGMIPILAA